MREQTEVLFSDKNSSRQKKTVALFLCCTDYTKMMGVDVDTQKT